MWLRSSTACLCLLSTRHAFQGLGAAGWHSFLSLPVLFNRAETILSGVIVRPDPEDPGSTKLSLMLQTDMKGWIPHMIVNTIAGDRRHQEILWNFWKWTLWIKDTYVYIRAAPYCSGTSEQGTHYGATNDLVPCREDVPISEVKSYTKVY